MNSFAASTFPAVGTAGFHLSKTFVASLYAAVVGNSFVTSASVHAVPSFTSTYFFWFPSIFPSAVASNVNLTIPGFTVPGFVGSGTTTFAFTVSLLVSSCKLPLLIVTGLLSVNVKSAPFSGFVVIS